MQHNICKCSNLLLLTTYICLALQLQAALAQKDEHITSLQEALAAKGDEVSTSKAAAMEPYALYMLVYVTAEAACGVLVVHAVSWLLYAAVEALLLCIYKHLPTINCRCHMRLVTWRWPFLLRLLCFHVQVQQLASQRLVLLTNMSSLFKTAQAEIKRHTTQLQATRLELVQLKAQLARAQRQPAGQAKAPKQQQQQQQQLPPPPKQQQQQSSHAMHDITASCLNQQPSLVLLQGQKQDKHNNSCSPQQQQQDRRQQQQQQRHRCQNQQRQVQQQQPGGHADRTTTGSCKRCRSSSPVRRPDGAEAATRHKQQKQHAGADAAAGSDSSRPSSNKCDDRTTNGHDKSRQGNCHSRPGSNISISAGRSGKSSRAGGGSGSSTGYNNAHGSGGGSGRSRSRLPHRDGGRGGSSRPAAAAASGGGGGGYMPAHSAGSHDRQQDRRRH
jgi:uncharacterized membrane protein YgcG